MTRKSFLRNKRLRCSSVAGNRPEEDSWYPHPRISWGVRASRQRKLIHGSVDASIADDVKVPKFLDELCHFGLGYQLLHSRNTCLMRPITLIVCRTFSAAISSLLFSYPKEPTCTGSTRPLKLGRTAECLPYNGRSGNWSHYVKHGQRVLSKVQTFCRTSLLWCHQWTGTAAEFQGSQEPLWPLMKWYNRGVMGVANEI